MKDPRELVALVRKYQAGLLLDTNVLLLFVAVAADRAFARRWKRTQMFTAAHIGLLELAVTSAREVVTTPHVLTEATNFLPTDGDDDPAFVRAAEILRAFAAGRRERHVEAKRVADDPDFLRLGLSDVAQISLASSRSRRPLVVTVDGPLTLALEARGLPCANLHHYSFAL